MNKENPSTVTRSFYDSSNISLDDFTRCCQKSTAPSQYPLAESVVKNVVVYSGDALRENGASEQEFKDEFAHALLHGPGILAIKAFYPEIAVVDNMSLMFEQILNEEKGFGQGDHFGQTGEQANGRIWNVFQKSAEANPSDFIAYYKNPLLKLVSEAWLGPHYQVTAQVNIVRPGGLAQDSHRDYHLGFQKPDEVCRYPLHAQQMSAMLTLQSAVAHTDMPLESGPTKLLPYSQHYPLGYLSYHDAAFQEYFEQHAIQIPLEKGDAVFFNPALVHAAGSNKTTDFHRSANLLQVSSVFGKPMETIDLAHISTLCYSSLLANWHDNTFSDQEKAAIITATTDGYSFPTNLDTDPPVGGMAPQTMAALLQQALNESWQPEQYQDALGRLQEKQQSTAGTT